MNLNTTISLSLVVGKAKNKIKNCHLGAGMSVIGDISDLLSRGSKVVGLNFDEEEEEEKYTTNCVPHLLSIPVEKYDKFCFLSFLSLHREMKTYPCLMVGWACRQTTLSATDPSITHTHTHLINPTFVYNMLWAVASHVQSGKNYGGLFVGCHPCSKTFIH
jgi:hypothetical protein